MQLLDAYLWGLLGGISVELHSWWKLRESKKLPHFAKRWAYWLPTVLMALFGGLFPLLYISSGTELSPLLAVHLGASAPVFVGNLSKAAPKVNR